MKIDFSNMNTENKNILEEKKTSKTVQNTDKQKADKRIQLYLTADEEQALMKAVNDEHLTVKQYILRQTIYAK